MLEKVARLVDAFANDCNPVHVLVFASKVEEAAVMVNVPPAVIAVELIVASVPVNNPAPIVVVDTSFPFSSVERSADVRVEKY